MIEAINVRNNLKQAMMRIRLPTSTRVTCCKVRSTLVASTSLAEQTNIGT